MVNLGGISSDHIFCIGFLFHFLNDTRPVLGHLQKRVDSIAQ